MRWELGLGVAILLAACGGTTAPTPPASGEGGAPEASAGADDPDAGYGTRCVSAGAQIACLDPVTGGETFDWYAPDGGSHGCADPAFPCPVGDACRPFDGGWTGTCAP